jgi:hypothetical protein
VKNILTTFLITLFSLSLHGQTERSFSDYIFKGRSQLGNSISIDTSKLDTIYDYGNLTPKEIDSLEKTGCVVIRKFFATSNMISSYITIYDTTDIVGLAIYLSPDDFEYGVDFKLLPTIKTVVRCRNCFTQTYLHNGFRFTSDNTLKARQLTPNGSNFIIDDILLPEWQEIDLSQYKEFLFIENPFIGNKNPFTK